MGSGFLKALQLVRLTAFVLPSASGMHLLPHNTNKPSRVGKEPLADMRSTQLAVGGEGKGDRSRGSWWGRTSQQQRTSVGESRLVSNRLSSLR
jgi:hypothetical protein